MPSLNNLVDDKLKKICGTAGYSNTADGTATVTGTLSHAALLDLIRSVGTQNHNVTLVSGVLTITRV